MTPWNRKGEKMKISLNGKEYESGKITREKYKKFAAVYGELLGKEEKAQTFSVYTHIA